MSPAEIIGAVAWYAAVIAALCGHAHTAAALALAALVAWGWAWSWGAP